eukprot:Seg36.10 transcript_id=Seg36.10/GoldUCD/mRNA.D3Y31 product="hypothetical protein" protein_id=Seg36.10/GoldUCD/D3Y31
MMVSKSKKAKEDTQNGQTLCISSQQLFDQAQSLVGEINAKRKNDSVLLNGKIFLLFVNIISGKKQAK